MTDDVPIFVVGYDGTPGAVRVTDFAVRMAQGRSAVLRFVYVHNTLLTTIVPELVPGIDAAALESDEEVRSELALRLGPTSVQWELDCVTGNPFRVLIETAGALGAEAIVLGSTRRTGLHLSGSLAVNLVKHGRWPIVVIPSGWSKPATPEPVAPAAPADQP